MLVKVQGGELKLRQVWQVQRLQASSVEMRGHVWKAFNPQTIHTSCRRTTAWCGLLH